MKEFLLRSGLFLMGSFLLIYSLSSFQKGRVFIRGKTYSREDNSLGFWSSLAVLFAFSLALIVAALVAKIQ